MYKRILVPIDGSPTSIRGLDEAIALAKLCGANLRLVHVLDRVAFPAGETYTIDVFGLLREAGERIVQQAKERAAAAGLDASTFLSEVLPGRVCDVVVEQVKEFGADLIVLGTHGRRGVSRLLVGSDAEQIVRVAPVPVLLVRAGTGPAPASGAGAA
jgi:nucleotide-binding universal stress UspA family protein